MAEYKYSDQEIVYGVLADSQLIFIPEQMAEEFASIQEAFSTSKTWGEFKARVPVDLYRRIVDEVREFREEEEVEAGGSSAPADSDPFVPEEIPGYDEAQWFGWPAGEMLDWMPEEIREKYGVVEDSTFDGPYLEIDADREAEVVAAMEALGYRCRRDQELIGRTYGYKPGSAF